MWDIKETDMKDIPKLFNDAVTIGDYIASIIGWLKNMKKIVEWKLARET
jgi:hypothetical protein